MTVLVQIAQAFFSGMGVAFQAFFSALQIKNAIDGVKEQMMASFFGVPVWVISLISFLMLIGGIAFALIRRHFSHR